MLALLAAVAVLAVPSGFTVEPVISARAAYVAQKPVNVYCATTTSAWQDFLVAENEPADSLDAHGLTTTVGGTDAYIDAEGCATLHRRLRGLTVSLPILGAVLDVVTHEAIHMRGTADEGQTECASIQALSAFVVHSWGFKKNSPAFRQVMNGAWSYHRRLAPQYRTVC
jgi:hypothetical protein